MTLKDYIEGLKKFVEENPDTLNLKVITSIDDEGNGFVPVEYSPSKGYFDGSDYNEHTGSDDEVNAVCVN